MKSESPPFSMMRLTDREQPVVSCANRDVRIFLAQLSIFRIFLCQFQEIRKHGYLLLLLRKFTMSIRSLSLAAAALMLCASASSMAAEQQGWYMGAGFGAAQNKVSGIDFLPGTEQKTNATGFKIYGGYQFNNNWAAEMSYMDLGKFSAESKFLSTSVKTSAFALSAVGILPLSNQFSLFGKLGLAAKSTSVDEYTPGRLSSYSQKKTTTAPLIGFGAEYHFTPSLALRGEYEYIGETKIGERDAKISNGLMSVSLRYSF